MTFVKLAALAFALGSFAAPSAAQMPQDASFDLATAATAQAAGRERLRDRLDKNDDGRVGRVERNVAKRRVKRARDRADVNDDGRVGRLERARARKVRGAVRDRAQSRTQSRSDGSCAGECRGRDRGQRARARGRSDGGQRDRARGARNDRGGREV